MCGVRIEHIMLEGYYGMLDKENESVESGKFKYEEMKKPRN